MNNITGIGGPNSINPTGGSDYLQHIMALLTNAMAYLKENGWSTQTAAAQNELNTAQQELNAWVKAHPGAETKEVNAAYQAISDIQDFVTAATYLAENPGWDPSKNGLSKDDVIMQMWNAINSADISSFPNNSTSPPIPPPDNFCVAVLLASAAYLTNGDNSQANWKIAQNLFSMVDNQWPQSGPIGWAGNSINWSAKMNAADAAAWQLIFKTSPMQRPPLTPDQVTADALAAINALIQQL